MNFRIIWNLPANIPEMSPNNFRKISHPGLEISLYLYNFSKKLNQLTDKQEIHDDFDLFQNIPEMLLKY